jgi:uncharacterized Zn-binding protein involved in type VI secretion
MKPIARLGDPGSHGGVIVTAAQRTICEGMLVARVTNIYACPIHGSNPIVTGSSVIVEAEACARTGSLTACGATIIGGAHQSFVD